MCRINGPRAHRQPAPPAAHVQVGQHVDLGREAADLRREPQAGVAARIGPEEDRPPFEEANLANGVMRKNVPRVVVGAGERHPLQARALLDIVQHRLRPLVVQIGGEKEDRAAHRSLPLSVPRHRRIVALVPRAPSARKRAPNTCWNM